MKKFLVIFIVIAVTVGFHPATLNAETLDGSDVEYRLLVALRVKPADLQSLLPDPWQVDPVAKGPLKDANLFVIFIDNLLHQDAEGKTALGGTYQLAVIAAPAKNAQTAESAPFVLRVYAPHEDISVVNPYKNTIRAKISREQTLKSKNLEPGTATELWEMKDDSGGMMLLQMSYQKAVPRRSNQELKPRSAVEPDFFRIYRVDQGSDLIKSIPANIDRTQNFKFQVTKSEFGELFDGSEEIIGVISIPWYIRKVFLP
jgi:hypothetical protein